MIMDVPLIQQYSQDLLLKEQLYKVFMKHLDSQSLMVLSSSNVKYCLGPCEP